MPMSNIQTIEDKAKSTSNAQQSKNQPQEKYQSHQSHSQVKLKRETMLESTLGANPCSVWDNSQLSSPMPNSTLDARSFARSENGFAKIQRKATVNQKQPNPVYEKYSQGSTASGKIYSKVDASSIIPQENYRRLDIKLTNGTVISKSFRDEDIIAAVLKNVFEKEVGTAKASDLGQYNMYLRDAKLNLFTKISSLDLKKGEYLQICKEKIEDKKLVAEDFADLALIPKLNLPGYKTIPSYVKLCRMTKSELSCVENFTIINLSAEVRFLEPINLLGVNLDAIIDFKHKSVEIYLDQNDRPPVGQGLNKPAQITFFDFGFSPSVPEERIRNKIESWVARIGAQIIKITPENDSVSIYVEHF